MNAAALYFLGEAREAEGRIAEAENRLTTLTKRFMDSEFYPYGLVKLGKLYSRQNKNNLALKTYRLAEKKAESSNLKAEAIFQIAEHHFMNNRFKLSAESYRRLIEQYPEHSRSSEAGLQAGWAMHKAERYEDALTYARKETAKFRNERNTELPADKRNKELAGWRYLMANACRQLSK